MKKRLLLVIVLSVCAGMFFTVKAEAMRGKGNLYDEYSKKDVTKVYIEDVGNPINNKEADLKGFKERLKNVLDSRKTVKFKVVNSAKEADMIIKTELNEFFWTDEDPVDMITGIGPVLMDAAVKENYARMQADFKVVDAKSGKVIWDDSEKATITDKAMSQDESISMLNDRLVDVFVRECFSKSGAKK